ncbi:MAG: dephospho-CoA kinase [Lachnospiraceae bacterium]|nr:dephospho-CoA kinase [Lachnospiraceae bacterium]
MIIIGITGGVGSGKSEVLRIIAEESKACILKADEVAHKIEEKGSSCYKELLELLGEGILDTEGNIDKRKMSSAIFSDKGKDLLEKVNGIVHPRVKDYILKQIKREEEDGRFDFFVIEAALLIEEGYEKICKELWYIYAKEDIRRKRLKMSRGYPDEKIDGIMMSQNPDSVFRAHCRRVIDNSGDLADTKRQILECLRLIRLENP